MKPLFVCHGNLMRSQMAEAYYNHLTNSYDAFSAGVSVFTPHQFKSPNVNAVMIMEEEGIDISDKPVKLVTPEMVEKADAVFVMADKRDIPEFIRKSDKTVYWHVADPFGQSTPIIRSIRDQIKSLVIKIATGKSDKKS